MRNEWRQGWTAILTQVLPLDHSSTSSSSWLGLFNHGSLRAAKPSVCNWLSLQHPVSNSYVTYSNSFVVNNGYTHIFAFHWLCCQLPIGYLPKPGSVGVRICHHHGIQPRLQVRRYSDILDQMHLFQHPLYSQHLWAWWHFGDHAGLINLSVNNICRIHTHRSH